LKKHGLEDKEELFDPITQQSFGKVLTGPQHIIKLTHQIDKKTAVRSGMPLPGDNEPESYDNNLLPIGGKGTGGQRMSPLGIYSLLAHGSLANIREMQTYKSEGDDPRPFGWPSQHREVWQAIQMGTALPPPRPTFAFSKFTSLLKAAGVNVEKKGHNIQMLPLTNKQITDMSNGRLPKPGDVTYTQLDANGEPKPKKGGLFDPVLTGGHGGKKWTHIKLSEPVPNPVFEGAIKKLLGMKETAYRSLVDGDKALAKDGSIVPLDTPNAITGGAAIKSLLDKIDVDKDLAAEQAALKKMTIPANFAHGGSTQAIDASAKKIRYLRALQAANMKPSDAYVLENLPILPPAMRPLSVLQDGSIKWDDLNHLYQKFSQVNTGLGSAETKARLDRDEAKRKARANLYDGVRAIVGVGTFDENDKWRGILRQVAGKSPKEGFFQKTLMNRRQDLSMRSVIVPEPALGLDEVGLPQDKALKLYRPFMVNKLVSMGAASNVLQARKMLSDAKGVQDPTIRRALELVTEERPLILKRDPVLHKHSVQAFTARLVGGKAIQVHPLVTGGYNADFDGDTMSAYVPIGTDAIAEARGMMPSNNLYAEATGRVTYQPSLDSALGLYKMSRVDKSSKRSYASPLEALKAAHAGELGMTEEVTVGGVRTTPGKMLISSALPKEMQAAAFSNLPDLNKKGLNVLYAAMAKDHKGEFGESASKLMRMGYEASHGIVSIPNPDLKGQDAIKAGERPDKLKMFIQMGAHTLGLEDLEPDRESRDKNLQIAQKEVDKINSSYKLTQPQKDRQIALSWSAASERMDAAHKVKLLKDKPNNLAMMLEAGTKPDWDQYKQLRLAPVMMVDSLGNPVPVPVSTSYSEGLDVGGYWTAAMGARRGSVRKVQEVSEPGYFSKKMIQNTINLVVNGEDCGTTRGVGMSIGDQNVYDRTLAQPFKAKNVSIPTGTLLTPDLVSNMRKADKNAQVVVRSALKCEHGQGLCQVCAGIGADGKHYPVGTNAGLLSAQSLGERSVQLPMKSFHCLYAHSMVMVRCGEKVLHSTLLKVHERVQRGEQVEVWDLGGWTKIVSSTVHPQQPGTAMVFARTRSGYGSVSQDNHPHMLRENRAVCSTCGNYPKKSNGGLQYHCRKGHQAWTGEPADNAPVEMVMPEQLKKKSHRATLCVTAFGHVTKFTPPIPDGWLAGMYCAEGSIITRQERGKSYSTGLTISQSDSSPVYQRLMDAAKAYFGKGDARAKGFQVYSVDEVQRFLEFGRYSRNIGLPEGWSGYPEEWLLSFLSGVIDGDGTVQYCEDSQWKRVAIDTTSFLLAQQVHWLLRKFGWNARIILTPWRKHSTHQGLRVECVISEDMVRKLSASNKLWGTVGCPVLHEERFEDVVDYIKPFRFSSPPLVYDIETESGTFFVDEMLTHNSGGIWTPKISAADLFTRVKQLTSLQENIPNSASLAMVSGKIEKIESDKTGSKVWIAGKAHHVGKDSSGFSLHQPLPGDTWAGISVGQHVAAGDSLSDPLRTVINPRQLYKATGDIDKVQNFLVDALHDIYSKEGVRRQHVETVVKGITNTTKIRDPGGSQNILKGEIYHASMIRAENTRLVKAGKDPIKHSNVLLGIDIAPLQVQQDWLAKMQHEKLRKTVMDGAASGAISLVHGLHPIPGIAYGAEFGRTRKDALATPGMAHVMNVKDYEY
jgi:DNA-directed RNA polymerase beta' subunit